MCNSINKYIHRHSLDTNVPWHGIVGIHPRMYEAVARADDGPHRACLGHLEEKIQVIL